MSVKEKLTAIADAIREKTGTGGAMTLDQMAEQIEGISVGEEIPTVVQATPVISVSSGGLITATATQSAGKVAAGTKSATKQLTVQGAQTITPGTSNKTIASGRYLTGTQTIQGDSNLKAENIVSGVKIFGVTGTAQGGGTVDTAADSMIDGSVTSVTSNVKTVRGYAFRDCDVVSVSLPAATEIGGYAFYSCMDLTTCHAPNVTTVGTYAFYSCLKLGEIVMPKLTKTVSNCFANCTGVVKADFTALTTIASGTFTNAVKMTALILRSNSLVSLASTGALSNSAIASGTGYVYVPASLVNSYKAATNWSTYAAQIRAIEDYPEITGG